jgi:probable HAF family extracellular repeat protein
VNGAWQIEQLDSRPGVVRGANSVGDLVGNVQVPCTLPMVVSQCSIGMIWYASGSSRELGSLGGPSTAPFAINAVGEVVGMSALANGDGFPFFWSEATGIRQLPVTKGGLATAVSGVRSDGTRIVVGGGGRQFSALVWVVRSP